MTIMGPNGWNFNSQTGGSDTNGNQKPTPVELMTPKQILAEGWRLTKAILALKGLTIPDLIEFRMDGRNRIQATRVATFEELANAIAALDEAIKQNKSNDRRLRRPLDTEELNKRREALAELQKLARRGGVPASTTVIEALFPDVPAKKRTPQEKAEIDRWLAIRKEEALKIDPETAEVFWSYEHTLDPYGVRDEWELPEEFYQVGREYFARAPGSDIWVEFGDLPKETRKKLWNRHSRNLAFPAGLEDLLEIGPSRGE